MTICLLCTEIFAWGKYGGFGRSTRLLGRELARRGVRVSAVVPRRDGQRPVEELDGITVLSFPMHRPWDVATLARQCDAELYHSQHTSYGSYLTMRAMPDRKHVLTFRDPKTLQDWLLELRAPTLNTVRSLVVWQYETRGVRQAVRRADAVTVCAEHLTEKVRRLYGALPGLRFLPSPIAIPQRPMQKDATPTVCFVARWDRRKQPERFFETARRRPDVRFIAVGASADRRWDAELRRRYSGLPNVELPGFLDQFTSDALSRVLERSWVLMNTASREGLPTAFLEALAHRCAILSAVNPDGFAERFGSYVQDGDFARGLDRLLEDDRWSRKAEQGYAYVSAQYELTAAVDRHLALYRELLGHSS